MLASLWDLPTELMERQNKHGEHKESRLCVSGIRIRFRWEPIGRFIWKQDTEAEQGRKKSNFFLDFIKTRFKWFKNTNSSNFTFAHYKNGHSDIFFFFSIQSISQVLLSLQWFPLFLVLSSYNQKHHPGVRGLLFSLPCIWKILSGLSLKRWQ